MFPVIQLLLFSKHMFSLVSVLFIFAEIQLPSAFLPERKDRVSQSTSVLEMLTPFWGLRLRKLSGLTEALAKSFRGKRKKIEKIKQFKNWNASKITQI